MAQDNTIEAGKRYTVDRYGDVQVLELSRWIDSATPEGIVEDRIVVKFDKNPDGTTTADRRIRTMGISEFIGSIRGTRSMSDHEASTSTTTQNEEK